MPELKNVFHAGKMNKDLDERLIPNGQYRDALNVDISFSESSDAGSAQNSYGNIKKSLILTEIANAKCIGYTLNELNDTIIWFICGTSVDAIAEYNPSTGVVVPILVDTNKGSINAFLNFNNDYLITGINILENFLFFTDNTTEPKKIHIGRMKNGSTNFSTTTKYQNSDGTYTKNIYTDLITVIKKYPLQAPTMSLSNVIREGNVNGIFSAQTNTSFTNLQSFPSSVIDGQDFNTNITNANKSGSTTIYKATDISYLETSVVNNASDNNANILGVSSSGFTTGINYKKWRSIVPGMRVAVSANGSSTWVEPNIYYTIESIDWLNYTISFVDRSLPPVANSTKVRIQHWSEPFNNSNFWAYTDNANNLIKKPIGTTSENSFDLEDKLITDGGALNNGSGKDVQLFQSTASGPADGGSSFGQGWSYNSSTKTYNFAGGSGATGTKHYPAITSTSALLKGHTYNLKATVTVTTQDFSTPSSPAFIGFHGRANSTTASEDNGLNGLETQRYYNGVHEVDIIWKQLQDGSDGQLCLVASDEIVGSIKINSIECLSKPRPVKIQPLQFFGTDYEVGDVISLQAEDSNAVGVDDNRFVDINVRLVDKITVRNTSLVPVSHTAAIGSSVQSGNKIGNGDFSALTTSWLAGLSGTANIGTSSAGFFVTGGGLSSNGSSDGYVRNVLTENLIVDKVYKLDYDVVTATTGSSNAGYLKLVLSTNNVYVGDDVDFGHTNHILLDTSTTGSKTIYFKQKSVARGALSLGQLLFYNDHDWDGKIDNVVLQRAVGVSSNVCGTIGTDDGKQLFDCEIISIDDSIVANLDKVKFKAKRLQPDAIYEKEFARFSFRWKYVDNEYSAISPFTEVAFLPLSEKGYQYDSKDGYNKSMVNDVRRITLSGLSKIPKDVKSVDILYKKSNAVGVYIVKSIEHSDFEELKVKDSVVISLEEIKSLLPENQMLRPYDNVPRKALAQEITGNRIVYGNYTQQYDYFSTPSKFKTKISSTEITDKPLKSLKSIRDYQVGVSYLDEFGRQSPVFTHESGVVKIDQAKSVTSNSLEISLNSPPPTWATHYKYFVKDSSNEYYNLAMDRFYPDLEDENVWISFPSSEINKVNENDYMAIKKEHGTEETSYVPVGETIKYKVLDKQAEPPNHIKFKMAIVGESSDKTTFTANAVVLSTDTNAEKNAKYALQTYSYPTRGSNTFLLSSYDLRTDPDFLDELGSFITTNGVWYDMDNRFVQIGVKDGTLSEKYEVEQIYKKSKFYSINPSSNTTPSASDHIKGITTGFKSLCFKTDGAQNNTSIDLRNDVDTSHSDGNNVTNLTLLEVGMRVTNAKGGGSYNNLDVFIVSISGETVKLSQPIEVTANQEIFFRSNLDSFYFRLKKPFGFDIEFVGSSPQSAKIELQNIASASFSSTNTVLPNPQDLDLKVTFFKQTTEGFGEEFKGKFFIKIKRDAYLNDFVTRTTAATNTWVSKDSTSVFSAKTWLLDQANSDAIVLDTNGFDSSPLIRSILNIPDNRNYKLIDGSYDHFNTAKTTFGKSTSQQADIAGQESYASVFSSGQALTLKGNGLNLNPESVSSSDFDSVKDGVDHLNGYSPVAWAATGIFNGSNIRLKFGGSTRGIMKSTVYGTQNSINGLSMHSLNYDTPSLSASSKFSRLVIDQTVGFRSISEHGLSRPEPYVGDGWVVGNTFCSFKITGIKGLNKTRGSIGDHLYNLYRYLTTVDQTFRFPSDPTNTVYKIVKAETFHGYNSDVRSHNGSIERLHRTFSQGGDPEASKFSEQFLGINIQLDKAIFWSPMEEVDKQGNPVLETLELTSNAYGSGKTFTSAEKISNREKYLSSNSKSFSACEIDFGEATFSIDSPAVFEVLPKDKVDLNIFYETPTTKMVLKDGMSVKTAYRTVNGENPLKESAVINLLPNSSLNRFIVSTDHINHNIPKGKTITVYKKDINGDEVYSENIVLKDQLVKGSGSVGISGSGLPTLNSNIINIVDSNWSSLKYFNCFAFGNGVESNRIFDDYNAVTIDKGPRVSTILDKEYAEEVKSNGLIYSGIYNSSSSVNNTNQFIQGEKITKDLNPDYGPIQKLFTRNTNIIVLCEDKTLKVLANKDALFNADGNPQLTATNKVLGQTVPFVGEYGISTNPESFASYGYRCYYSDRKRGAVIRLSGDGITNISEKGMSRFFRENLNNSLRVLGSYDSLKSNYNITLNSRTLSFTEKVNGWVSFKSFVPENGVSCNNSYYTFKQGEIWLHNENLNRNDFYGDSYDSTIKLVFNGEPDTVKDFKTISYEGDTGWVASTITTDKESGSVPSFIEKEGKYFNFIKGALINNDVDLLKTQGLNVQGIGKPSTITLNGNARSFTHTITALDVASNTEPKKWRINNSSTDSTSVDNRIKINKKTTDSGSTIVNFYIHPLTSNGIAWKLDNNDFSFTVTEPVAIGNFSGAATTVMVGGMIKVAITITASSYPITNTRSVLTITAGSAYQEQI